MFFPLALACRYFNSDLTNFQSVNHQTFVQTVSSVGHEFIYQGTDTLLKPPIPFRPRLSIFTRQLSSVPEGLGAKECHYDFVQDRSSFLPVLKSRETNQDEIKAVTSLWPAISTEARSLAYDLQLLTTKVPDQLLIIIDKQEPILDSLVLQVIHAFQQKYPNGMVEVFAEPNILQKRAACKYPSEAACITATGNCSSHGSCRILRGCWSCSCTSRRLTDDAGKPIKGYTGPVTYTGDACQYQDISVAFHIFFWTIIAGIIITIYSVSLIASTGSSSSPSWESSSRPKTD